MTARLRLTLGYACFLVGAGAVTMAILYLGMRYVPNYPLTAANPRDTRTAPSREEILDTLVTASGAALAVLAVIGLAGGWLLAGWVLRPLQHINRAAVRAANGSLDHRIRLTGRKDEFTDLADTFDTMLDRLQRSFDEQRRFAANASHELRTPLAITRTMLQVALADPDGPDDRLLTRLYETNQRGIEIIDALLQLSSLDSTPLTTAPVDLAAVAAQALEACGAEAAQRGIAVSADLRPVTVQASDVLLRRAIGNLLENAVRHNLSSGGSLTITTGPDSAEGGRALLTVTNTGPRLPADAVETYLEPFLRGRGRTADPDPTRRGHGLGLALTSRITAAHHGTLRLVAAPQGGLTVRLFLPGQAEERAAQVTEPSGPSP
ncbi:sensor histidine kinase [Actinocorallia populi]|uniref:sensor histidine kinase n=1 Tax=Actinocorallia populi TaxID=2079200 RepID=UPI001E3809BF|nr:HAMP domain-containing sensor histidine kinase [Actinocorallia populi]